jgi:hypothetical protein
MQERLETFFFVEAGSTSQNFRDIMIHYISQSEKHGAGKLRR